MIDGRCYGEIGQDCLDAGRVLMDEPPRAPDLTPPRKGLRELDPDPPRSSGCDQRRRRDRTFLLALARAPREVRSRILERPHLPVELEDRWRRMILQPED